MAYQQVPNTVEIAVHYAMDGIDIVNTYHAQAPGGYSQSDLDTLAAQIDITPASGILADMSVEASYVQTVVRGLNAENDLTATANTNAGLGSRIEDSHPNNVAFCVQRYSGLTGRSARGRVYICGIPYSYRDAGAQVTLLISTAAAAAYVGHVEAFRTTIEAIGPWNAVIVSRYAGGAKRAVAVTFPWIGSQFTTRKFATMRKRMS